MKMIFEAEDAIVGIICGALVLGYAGKFFSLKLNPYAYAAAFIILIFFIFLDLFNEFKDLSSHFVFKVISILHNLIDLIISLAFISFFAGLKIAYVTDYLVPYFKSVQIIAGIGIFLVAANVVWLFIFPFAE